MYTYLTVTFSNGTTYNIPVEVIARNRANFFKNEFNGDIERSLSEDTIPLFESNIYEIEAWAENNMKWKDFSDCKISVANQKDISFDKEWIGCKKYFSE